MQEVLVGPQSVYIDLNRVSFLEILYAHLRHKAFFDFQETIVILCDIFKLI